MKEKEELYDHFISAVINTLNAEEIYDATIEALQISFIPTGFY